MQCKKMSWLLVAALVSLVPATAMAQETNFQVEQFEPQAAQGINLLSIARSKTLGHLAPSAGLFFHYVKDPIQLVPADGNADADGASKIIGSQVKGELLLGIGFFDIVDLGVALPFVLSQSGEDLAAFGRAGESIEGFAISDMRVTPKVMIVNPEWAGGFGLSLLVPIYVPIGDTASFNSDGAVRFEPRLALDWSHSSGFAVAANAGFQARPVREARNFVSGNMVRWGGGLQIPVGYEPLKVIGSVFGTIPLEDAKKVGALDESDLDKGRPIEALGGLQLSLPANLVAQAGAGAGLNSSVGSPALRVFASLSYTPMAADKDGDGILDKDDQCPEVAEDKDGFEDMDGCPDLDNDKDGILDVDDSCPDEPGIAELKGCPAKDTDGDGLMDHVDQCPEKPEDKDGFQDEDGCPDEDNDKDGILDVADKCPMDAEDKDQFEDEDGCPDPDNDGDGVLDGDDECPIEFGVAALKGCPVRDKDGDGIPDDKDKCPDQPETYNGNKDDDGCPDGKQTVTITETEVQISETVYFDTGKDTIQKRSFTLLDTVATVLIQNPQITGIQVEGHTDDVGNDADNLDLSKRRAKSVMRYMIEKGVPAERLSSEGFGESKPKVEISGLKSKKLKDARAANRRVTFKITSLKGKKIEATDSVIIKDRQVTEEPAPN
jgi:outer membrane protein OmpA-like peptidoglycan-associated protein